MSFITLVGTSLGALFQSMLTPYWQFLFYVYLLFITDYLRLTVDPHINLRIYISFYSFNVSFYPPICLSFHAICMVVCFCTHVYVSTAIYLYAYMYRPAYIFYNLSIYLSLYLSINLSIYLSIYLSICLYIYNLSTFLHINLYMCASLSTYQLIDQSFYLFICN